MDETGTPEPIASPGAQRYSGAKILLDAVLLFLAFAAAFFIKRGHLHIEGIYLKFLPLYFGCWLLSSLLTGKLRRGSDEQDYMKRLEPIFSSGLFFIGMLSLFIYGLNWYKLSRFIVFGSLGIFLLLEVLLLSGNYLFRTGKKNGRFSIVFFLVEFLLITLSFFAIHFLKIGTLELQESYDEVLLLIYFLWIFTGLVVHRFQVPVEKRNYFRMIYPFLKSNFIVLSIASLFVFGFRTGFSRLLVFGSLAVYACCEILIITVHYLRHLRARIDVPKIDLFEVTETPSSRIVDEVVAKEQQEPRRIGIEREGFTAFASPLVREKLRNTYLKRFPAVFAFVDRVVDLDTVDILHAEVIDTGNPYNVEILPDHSLEFFMNLHTLNDYRRVNQYLIEVNRKIKDRGIFVSRFAPCERRRIYFLNNYPPVLANALYFFDFTWKRVFPRLPILKKIYFAVTRGKNRLFSLAEALGRLYFCGFEIVSLERLDDFVYFVAQKVKVPRADTTPSYGPLFKQKRVGKDAKFVYIYKLRTMYPYSEYIHQYAYDKFKLDEKGKIKDDFRITTWGKIFRALWIDEVPMLFNWLKRDMKIVGVRPLSETFYRTYPEDLKKERTRYKPGLIPPYYADMPQSIEEVWQSERDYLQKYRKHPLRTDLAYFFKAMNNILFHKAKSR